MIDKEISQAISHVWNNKFDLAELTLMSKAASHPRYSLHYAETAFLRSFITADQNDTELALKRLKDTKDMSESHIKLLDSYKCPPGYTDIKTKEQFKNHLLDCKVVLGDSLYMLAVLQITRDHKFKGCFNMRKSWKVFEEALKQVRDGFKYDDQLLECLHFGAGFFFFAMSIIPQKFLKIVEFVGFKADRELGLQYIRECSTSANGIRSPFATMVLLFNNLLLPRGLYNPAKHLKEAELLLDENMQRYPEGSLFQVMASHCYRKQCRIDEGLECMKLAISNCSSFKRPPAIYNYELANCYCMRLEWEKAIELFEELIKEETFQIRALCALQLASCYFAIGQSPRAMEILGRVKSYAKKSSSVDPIIVRQAARYQQNGGHFSAFEIMYIRRDMAKMEKRSAELALDALTKVAASRNVLNSIPQASSSLSINGSNSNNSSQSASSFLSRTFSFGMSKSKQQQPSDQQTMTSSTVESINDRAAYLMLKGAILKGVDRVDESMVCFEEVLALQAQLTEKFYYPYCLYEMSESHFHRKNHEASFDYLKRCNSVTGYDWEDPLKVRLRVTMDQIKKDGAGVSEDWGEEEENYQPTSSNNNPSVDVVVITQPDGGNTDIHSNSNSSGNTPSMNLSTQALTPTSNSSIPPSPCAPINHQQQQLYDQVDQLSIQE